MIRFRPRQPAGRPDWRKFGRGALLGAALSLGGLAAEMWLSNNVGALPGMQPGFYRSSAGRPHMEWRAEREPGDGRRHALTWNCSGGGGGVLRLIGYESTWSTPSWRNREARWTDNAAVGTAAGWIWGRPSPATIEPASPEGHGPADAPASMRVRGSRRFWTVRLTDPRTQERLAGAEAVRIEDGASGTVWTAHGDPLAAQLLNACAEPAAGRATGR